MLAGSTIADACEGADIARATIYNWMKEDEEFRLAIGLNKKSAIKIVEDSLFRVAAMGDVQAIKYYLNNRAGDEWKDSRNINISGSLKHGSAKELLEEMKGMKEATRNESAANTTVDTHS